MKKELKEKIIWKHETRKELIRDITGCIIICYVATLAFLLIDSRLQYINAETEYVDSQIPVMHSVAPLMD